MNIIPDAWDGVDDLMNRTAYGEHMARFWLDLARYADTHGLHLTTKEVWLYRDWVVKAFNQISLSMNLPVGNWRATSCPTGLLINKRLRFQPLQRHDRRGWQYCQGMDLPLRSGPNVHRG